MMSDIITPNFGKSPMMDKGDFVRFADCDDDCCHGIIVSVDERYRYGDIAGQARILSVAIPAGVDIDDEDGDWTIERDVEISELVRVVLAEPIAIEGKEGKVLEFCVR
jgi:hypothetical protein